MAVDGRGAADADCHAALDGHVGRSVDGRHVAGEGQRARAVDDDGLLCAYHGLVAADEGVGAANLEGQAGTLLIVDVCGQVDVVDGEGLGGGVVEVVLIQGNGIGGDALAVDAEAVVLAEGHHLGVGGSCCHNHVRSEVDAHHVAEGLCAADGRDAHDGSALDVERAAAYADLVAHDVGKGISNGQAVGTVDTVEAGIDAQEACAIDAADADVARAADGDTVDVALELVVAHKLYLHVADGVAVDGDGRFCAAVDGGIVKTQTAGAGVPAHVACDALTRDGRGIDVGDGDAGDGDAELLHGRDLYLSHDTV